MRVKLSLYYVARLFGVENMSVRVVFSELLGSDSINALESRYSTLEDLSEASDNDLLSIPGITEETVKLMRSTVNALFKSYVDKDLSTKMPKNETVKKRILYADIMKEAECVCTVKRLKKSIKKLPKREKQYLRMQVNGKKPRQIAKALKIPVQDLGLFQVLVYARLREKVYSK